MIITTYLLFSLYVKLNQIIQISSKFFNNLLMGSCVSKPLVESSKTVNHKDSKVSIWKSNNYLVNPKELEVLKLLFKDLALRNSSTSLLDKTNFLLFVSLPVFSIQGVIGERLFNMIETKTEGFIKLEEFLLVIENFTRVDKNAIIRKIFTICDLKNDLYLDEEELLITVSFI